jgi:hypothetical protein
VRLLHPAQAAEQHGAVQVRLDVARVERERAVEGRQRLRLPVDEREREAEQVEGVGVRDPLAHRLLEQQHGPVVVAHGEALARARDRVGAAPERHADR